MRKTKGFSYDSRDDVWFQKLEREAKSQSPRVSGSQMLVHILKDWFDRKRMMSSLNISKRQVTTGRATDGD